MGCGCFLGASVLVIVLTIVGILFFGGAVLMILIVPILLVISFLVIRWLIDWFW